MNRSRIEIPADTNSALVLTAPVCGRLCARATAGVSIYSGYWIRCGCPARCGRWMLSCAICRGCPACCERWMLSCSACCGRWICAWVWRGASLRRLQHRATAIPGSAAAGEYDVHILRIVIVAPDLIVVRQFLAGLYGAQRLDEN